MRKHMEATWDGQPNTVPNDRARALELEREARMANDHAGAAIIRAEIARRDAEHWTR